MPSNKHKTTTKNKSTTNSNNYGSNNARGNFNVIGSNNYTQIVTQVNDYKVDLLCIRGAHYWDIKLACKEGTRVPVIQDIRDWIFNEDTCRIYFLVGGIHSGKSAISHRIAETLDDEDQLRPAATIFLPLSPYLDLIDTPITARMVVNTIAVGLASHNLEIGRLMSENLRTSPLLGDGDTSATQVFRHLVVPSITGVTSNASMVIILDVLDQVYRPEEREELLLILTKYSARLPSNVRILVTTHPRNDVLEIIRNDRYAHQLISLYDEPGVGLADVTLRAASNLLTLRQHCTFTHAPEGFLKSALQDSTSSLAATSIVSMFLAHSSDEEFICLLDTARLGSKEIPGFGQPSHLYFLILWAIANYGMGDHITGELPLLAFLMEPRSANDKPYFSLVDVKFNGLRSGSVYSVIAPIPAGRNNVKPDAVYTPHPDIIESILVPPSQAVSPPGGYPARDRIAELCLQILCDELHSNPLSIDTTVSPKPASQGSKYKAQENISKPINYASRHVIGHITVAVGQSGLPRILELFQRFLREHVSHWLELLNHLEAFGRSTILDLEGLLQCLKGQPDSVQNRDELRELVSGAIESARRFSPPSHNPNATPVLAIS
ncbi:hypothetical protein BD779DRAFT_1678419 [Infundibulicybe gibba]|nr:hypothetical protein BD779DRAFT_1678419 [Infundibulicybe gibba]